MNESIKDIKVKLAELEKLTREREQFIEREYNDSISLDKNMLLISGVVFSLMIGFVDNIIPLSSAKIIYAFYVPLGLLALSISLTIATYKISIYMVRIQINSIKEYLENEDPKCIERANKKFDFFENISNLFNEISFYCTFFSIFILFFFIIYNIVEVRPCVMKIVKL